MSDSAAPSAPAPAPNVLTVTATPPADAKTRRTLTLNANSLPITIDLADFLVVANAANQLRLGSGGSSDRTLPAAS